MRRLLGYHERPPFLWHIDLDDRTVAATGLDLPDIPEGIDDLVPLDDSLAVGCGPEWFKVRRDLAGGAQSMTEGEIALARQRSFQVPWPDEVPAPSDLRIPTRDGGRRLVSHLQVAYWHPFPTWSPDRRHVAAGGSTAPRDEGPLDLTIATLQEYQPQRASVLALIEVDTGDVICDGRFDNFCYPPLWSAQGDRVVFGAPFEPRRLYGVDVERGTINPVAFRRDMPLSWMPRCCDDMRDDGEAR